MYSFVGAMNLHGYLAQNRIPYESKHAIEFVDAFFRTVNYWTIQESVDTAIEKNETFYGFKGSDFETGKYFERYDEDFVKTYRDWETDRKSTRLNSSHRSLSRMPSSA